MKKIFLPVLCAAAMCACDKKDNRVIVRHCDGYEVQMTFSEGGDTMDADINGDKLTLQRAVAASGAKYDGVLNDTSVILWGKGDDWLMILDDDMVIECTSK